MAKKITRIVLTGGPAAGKTTVFNLLTKVYQPTHGTILLNGMDTHNMTPAQVSQAGIGRTFQNIRLFKDLSVLDNVKVGLHNLYSYSTFTAILRLPKYRKTEKEMNEVCLGGNLDYAFPPQHEMYMQTDVNSQNAEIQTERRNNQNLNNEEFIKKVIKKQFKKFKEFIEIL